MSCKDGCLCFSGQHIWDEKYEQEVKSEKWCLCCEHFFPAEDVEDNLADEAIIWKEGSLLNKPQSNPSSGSKSFAKGVIKRRT